MVDFIARLKFERQGRIQGIYWLLQVNTAYNSNRIEGSTMTHNQTQHLFEKNELKSDKENPNVSIDDIQETINHFEAFDYVLDHVEEDLSPEYVKHLHKILKDKTSDEKNPLTLWGSIKQKEIGSVVRLTL